MRFVLPSCAALNPFPLGLTECMWFEKNASHLFECAWSTLPAICQKHMQIDYTPPSHLRTSQAERGFLFPSFFVFDWSPWHFSPYPPFAHRRLFLHLVIVQRAKSQYVHILSLPWCERERGAAKGWMGALRERRERWIDDSRAPPIGHTITIANRV
jgi:hypothetical protein